MFKSWRESEQQLGGKVIYMANLLVVGANAKLF
jgi:hypothetical protein